MSRTERAILEEAVRDHLRRAITAVESARIALFDLLHGEPDRVGSHLPVSTVNDLVASVEVASRAIHAARNRAGVIDG